MSNNEKTPKSDEIRPQKTERDYQREIAEAKSKQQAESTKIVDEKLESSKSEEEELQRMIEEEDKAAAERNDLEQKLAVAKKREEELAKNQESTKPVDESKPKELTEFEKQQAIRKLEEDIKKYEGYGDLTQQCLLVNMSSDDINEWLTTELRGMQAEEQRRVLRDTNSLMFRLLRANNNASNSSQAELMIRALRELSDSNRNLTNSVDTLIKDKSTSGGKFSNELHGNKAALAFTARLKGLKKVYLYNSGFHIDLRPFELAELNEFFMSVDNEGDELGRVLGGHFYMIHDLFVKQKFMELLPLAVVGSNLKNWDRGDVLAQNISINDYDTLLWAVCSLMYRKGVRVDMVCADPQCGNTTHNILHDISKMRMVDVEQLGEEAIEWISKGAEVTTKDLERYRKEIINQTKTFDDKNVRYHLRVPSIHEVLNYGNKLMSVITSKVQGEPTLKNDQVMSRVLINYNRSFVPWIEKIEMVNEDDPNKVDFSSTSHEAFHSVLEVRVDDPDDGTVLTNITEFMRNTKLCHICYPAAPCAACGKVHPKAVDGMLAWDAQFLFFSLTYRRLEPIGIV